MPTEIITDQPLEYSYVATAGQDEFDFNFQIFNDAADLYVEVDGVEVGAYSITLNTGDNAEGGYITLDSACVGGEVVLIRRVLAVERVTQFPNTGAVAMPTVNHELNRIVGLVQQISQEVADLEISVGYSDENALDAVGTALTAGDGISITVDDVSDTITIASTITEEAIRDTVGTALVAGAGIEIVVDDVNDTITIQGAGGSGGSLTTEDIRDVVGAALVAGAGISITVDDLGDTITIANTSGAYTDEDARDAIGAALTEGSGIAITVNDAGDTITVAQDLTKTLSLFIPAAAMKPRTTNGAAAGSFESTANDINIDTLDFDSTTSEGAHFHIRMPKSVNENGNFTARFSWITGTASGGVRWGLKYLVLRDGSTIDAAMTAAGSVTDSVLATTELHMSAATSSFSITGLQAEDLVIFEVYRDVSHAGDTMAGDAKLVGIDLKIPFTGFDDA